MDWMSFIASLATKQLDARNQEKADDRAIELERAKVSASAPLGVPGMPAWVVPVGIGAAVLGIAYLALR